MMIEVKYALKMLLENNHWYWVIQYPYSTTGLRIVGDDKTIPVGVKIFEDEDLANNFYYSYDAPVLDRQLKKVEAVKVKQKNDSFFSGIWVVADETDQDS